MSIEIQNTPSSQLEMREKANETEHKKKTKKRKRHTSNDPGLASPTKKQRATHHAVSALAQDITQSYIEPPTSPFFKQRYSLYLPLPPIAQKYPVQGLCAECLSPLILTYYPPFHGVILSYDNASLSSSPNITSKPAYARAVDEYAASFVWLTADFVVFKPQKGDFLEGWVNLQNESNIGLLCLNFFNATIERKRLANGWQWIAGGSKPPARRKLKKAADGASSDSDGSGENVDGKKEQHQEDVQGYFQGAQGNRIEGLIRFKVKDVETSRSIDRETGFLNIEGTMLSDEEEVALREQEATLMIERGKKRSKHAVTRSLMNGYDGVFDVETYMGSASTSKHRAKY